MKRLIKILIFVTFVGILIFTPTIYYVIKCIGDEEVIKKIDFDLNENRGYNELEYNNLFDFPSAFDNYFNDHIPFRSFFIQGKRNIDSFVERPYIQGLEEFLMNIGKKKAKRKGEYQVQGESYMDYAVKQFTNHALMPSEEDLVSNDPYPMKTIGNVIIGKKNWFFLNSENIPYYTGENVLSDTQCEEYVKRLEALDSLCKEKGKKIIFLMMPEKEQVYSEYMPQIERVDTVGKIGRINEYIASYSDITYIYPDKVLRDKKRYYRVYRKYDTHYNNAGAYIVHNEIMKAENKKYIDIDDVHIDKIESNNKDLVWMSGQSDSNYKDDVDYYLYYYEDRKCEKIFEDHNNNSGDVNTWIDIYESDVDNEELLFFYGDSFKENIKHFLSKDYKRSVFMGTRNPRTLEMLKNSVEACSTMIIEVAGRNEGQFFNDMMNDVTKVLKNLKSIQKD